MDEIDLPEPLQILLRERIHSYDQLEVLLLLRAKGASALQVAHIAAALCLSESAVKEALLALRQRGLVAAGAEPGSCQYLPEAPELDPLVAELAHIYTDRRLDVMRALTANSIGRLRASAAGVFDSALSVTSTKKDET